MPLSAQEKLERKRRLEEKREARKLAKEKKVKEKASKASSAAKRKVSESQIDPTKCFISTVSDDTLHNILWYLAARDMGALTLTCRHFSKLLVDARESFLMARLHRPNERISGTTGCVDLCSSQNDAREIVKQSYGGGDTRRIIAKGKARKEFVSEFVSYARFLEEAVCGYATQNYGGKKPTFLPAFVNGRFVGARWYKPGASPSDILTVCSLS